MKKILTISIAAYNVEKYIEETLNSLICQDIDKLEIFVVDDGSKDNTKNIAEKYAKKYPNSIFVISKENGGYGSTFNTAVKLATGKYFKLLDGDDMFENKNISEFLAYLEKVDSDAVLSNYNSFESNNKNKYICTNYDFEKNDEYSLKDICGKKCHIAMHAIAFKTAILKDNNVLLTEKCFYTDQEYVLYPLAHCNKITFFNKAVYLYRIGLADQSVSITGSIKHIDDRIKIVFKLAKYYKDNFDNLPKELRAYYEELVAITAITCEVILIIMSTDKKAKKETLKKLKVFDKTFKAEYRDIYKLSKREVIRPWVIIRSSDKKIKLKTKRSNRTSAINFLRFTNFLFTGIVAKFIKAHLT